MEMKVIKTYKVSDMQNPDAVIKRMESSWQAAYRNTQVALVATVVSLYVSGDKPTAVARANRIVEAVSVAGNAKAIVEWFTTFGFKCDAKAFTEAPERPAIADLCGDGFKKAKELMWWTLKPQNAFAGFNLSAALTKVLADVDKMNKRAANSEEDATIIKIDPALHRGLIDLLSESEAAA
jgi:hypothetical protein